jgi:uncharacterized damage-inducible protein DinB
MNAVKLLQRLHQHRAWVNRNLLTATANLSDGQLRSPFAIGQGSIWKSLVHLHAGEYVWLEALLGNDDPLLPGDLAGKLPGNQQGEGGITGLDDLRQKWSALEERWVGYLAALTPAALEEVVYKKSTSSGLGKRWGTMPTFRRRSLALRSISDLRHEIERLDEARRQGCLEAGGNWSLDQCCQHLGRWIEFSFDGFPFQYPWPYRLIGRIVRLVSWRWPCVLVSAIRQLPERSSQMP